MFNKAQLDRIEKKLDGVLTFLGIVASENSLGVYLPEKPVSPAKKRGRPAKKDAWKKRVNDEINALPTKRKYVRSGKYAKVTTKKK